MADSYSHAITFRKPGVQPPVYLVGTFSDPEWVPTEMKRLTEPGGKTIFASQVPIELGRDYQFKFKLGSEAEMTVDDQYPIATDEKGSKVNVLKVPSETQQALDPKNTRLTTLMADGDTTGDNRSSTPIEQVARTAAEVADTAAQLDKTEAPLNQVQTGTVEEDLKTPLFAHETFGAYHVADDGLDHAECGSQAHAGPTAKDKDYGVIDINDPTLERFPTDKDSVMSALRKIQSSTSEDRVQVDDVDASLFADPRRTTIDSADENSLPSLSPTSSRHRDSRLSHGSGRSKSAASLGAIAEEPKGNAPVGGIVAGK